MTPEQRQRALTRIRHGHSQPPTAIYRAWTAMKTRCNNKAAASWPDYGGRGIKVCERWMHSFENFLADMGEKPRGMTLDRINNDGNYEPGNCRWATASEQVTNRRATHLITYGGETMCLAFWARRFGVYESTLRRRIANFGEEMAMNITARKASGPVAHRKAFEHYAGLAAEASRERIEQLEAALRWIADEGDYTAPEGMKRVARAALAKAAT